MSKLKYSKKGKPCPKCASSDAFFPIFNENGVIVENVGKCFSCGEFFKSSDKKNEKNEPIWKKEKIKPFSHSLTDFQKWQNLPIKDTFQTKLIEKYSGISFYLKRYSVFSASISGNKFWTNFTAFPKIARTQEVRGVKCFIFDENFHTEKYEIEGKFKKKINWLHSLKKMEIPDTECFEDCYFGENLINKLKYKYIGVVESEKSAIIGNYFFGEDWIFLACGSKNNINKLKYKGIGKDTPVVLFPDADGLAEWQLVANEENYILCHYCKQLIEKQDIADILLETEDGINLIQSVETQLNTMNGGLQDVEYQYYNSIFSKIFSKINAISILNDDKILVERDEWQRLLVFEDGDQILFSEFLYKKNKDYFFELLKIKHIPTYDEALLFDFSTTNEQLEDIVMNGTLFFKDCFYNIETQRIENENISNFEISNHIRQAIENLQKSSVCDLKNKFWNANNLMLLNKSCLSSENKPLKDIVIKKTLGSFEKYENANFNIDFEAEIKEYLHKYFIISDLDINKLIFFCCSAIQKRFFDNYKFARMLFISGDSGIGKDSFFPSLLSGCYIKDCDFVFQNKMKENKFDTLSSSGLKKLLYIVVSDDLNESNQFGLNDITNEVYVVNNKGVQQTVVKNNFSKIITANFNRILFSKEFDKNAMGRRFLNAKIQYIKGWKSHDYLDFFLKNYDENCKMYDGFFSYCWHLSKKPDVMQELNSLLIAETQKDINDLLYLTNEDMIVCENFTRWVKNRDNAASVDEIKVKEVDYYAFNCNFSIFTPKREMSSKAIRNVLEIKFGMVYKNVRIGDGVYKRFIIKKEKILETY